MARARFPGPREQHRSDRGAELLGKRNDHAGSRVGESLRCRGHILDLAAPKGSEEIEGAMESREVYRLHSLRTGRLRPDLWSRI